MENLPQVRHFSKQSVCANSFSYHNHFTGREDFSPTFQMERMEARTSQSNLPNVPTWLSGGIPAWAAWFQGPGLHQHPTCLSQIGNQTVAVLLPQSLTVAQGTRLWIWAEDSPRSRCIRITSMHAGCPWSLYPSWPLALDGLSYYTNSS